MNNMTAVTTLHTPANTSETAQAPSVGSPTAAPPPAGTTILQAITTAAPSSPDSAVVAVVVVLILLTAAALAFLLYRYLCHNKGDYRTTGEPAPGDDFEDERAQPSTGEKKEYFI